MILVYLAVAWHAGIALAQAVNLPWQALAVMGLLVAYPPGWQVQPT